MTTQVTLPPSLMRAIKLICTDAETKPEQAYTGAVLIAFGYGLWEQQEIVDPTSVAIPEEQWGEICQLLIDMKASEMSDISRVNFGLSWMNQGPSGFKPEGAAQL
jgi:hypothetical protein